MSEFLVSSRKYLISALFSIMFIFALIHNIPSWVLGNIVRNYSNERLRLYDTQGTFWQGRGLLVAVDDTHRGGSSPLLYVDWSIKLGITKFVDIEFSVENKRIAEVYLNKNGTNLDNLDVSLSISQVSELLGPVKNLNISGNVRVSTDHMTIGKMMLGAFKINLDNISSGISRVNPLGSYIMNVTPGSGEIDINSNPGSALMLSGNGTFNGLSLKARVDEAKREEMLQFITVMGVQNPDGSYQLKIF